MRALQFTVQLFYSKFYLLIVCRSQIQLQNLGLDAFEGGNKEEDSSINVVSDGEKTNNHAGSPQDEVQACDSPSMKVPDLNQAAHEELQLHGTSLNCLHKFYMIIRWGDSGASTDSFIYITNI